MTNRKHLGIAVIALAGLMSPVFAGPPMICDAFESSGDVLPLDEKKLGKQFSRDELVLATVGLLNDADSVIQRMETIRRASIHASKTKDAPEALFNALAWRALSTEAKGDTRAYADALFDAGYLAATLGNLGVQIDGSPAAAEGIEGYAWIVRAIDLAKDDPSMHFAAALATHPVMRSSKRDLFEYHVVRAANGKKDDVVLAKNLDEHMAHFDESVDRIVARAEGKRDGG